jgi:phage gpG-like protein
MKFNEAAKIIKDMEKSAKAISEMVDVMGVMAINHYKKSFINGGFTDEGFVAWQKRKRTKGNQGRAILVKTGRLKRSLVARKSGRYAVKITSNVPYANVHNEGLTINKKERQHTLNFNIRKDGRSRSSKAKKANFQQDVTIGAHSIKMPKRQFVGYSGMLSAKIELRLRNKIQRIFK